MISTTLSEAWRTYRRHFLLIAASTLIIWIPSNLFLSYLDYFVIDPDDLRTSIKIAQALDNFLGIIATAAVISIAGSIHAGEKTSLGLAMSKGLGAWWRVFWTRFLAAVMVVVGLILLVIPGLYLFVRLMFVEAIAVCEGYSGSAAIQRSLTLTQGRFWSTTLLTLATVAIMGISIGVPMIPISLFPDVDHWIADAALSCLMDVGFSFGTVFVTCAFLNYVELQAASKAPNLSAYAEEMD